MSRSSTPSPSRRLRHEEKVRPGPPRAEGISPRRSAMRLRTDLPFGRCYGEASSQAASPRRPVKIRLTVGHVSLRSLQGDTTGKLCVVIGCKTTRDRSARPSCPTSSHSLAAEDSHPRQRDVFFLRGIGSLSSSSSSALRICTACYNFAKNRVHFQPVHKAPREELSAVDLTRLTSVEFFLEHILPRAGCTVIFRVLSELHGGLQLRVRRDVSESVGDRPPTPTRGATTVPRDFLLLIL